jgi:glycosyltransferase involved in cell wall biosynthesis
MQRLTHVRPRVTREPQRIAHIMPWDGVGGTEHGALRIGRAVGDAGFETIFFCLDSAPLVRNFFASAGYETSTWRATYPTFTGYRQFLRESMQLAKAFRQCRISLVHCGDVPAGAYAALAGRLALVPVICHVRNRYQNIAEPDRHMLRAVTTFAFVSRDSWRAFGFPVPAHRGDVVYDGSEVADRGAGSDDEIARRDVRREFNIPDEATIIGMVARIDQQKDYETLARAAARVVAVDPNVHFLIVGGYSNDETQRQHFEKVKQWLRTNNVVPYFTFTDLRTDVPRLLRAMDIVVLSTHYEGLPLAVLEAMACGKPVVATAVDGVPEIVIDNQTGLLFSHRDDSELASHLLSLIHDRSQAVLLGERARSFVQSHFSQEQFRDSIVALYRRVLARNKLSASVGSTLRPVTDLALKAGFAALDAGIRR